MESANHYYLCELDAEEIQYLLEGKTVVVSVEGEDLEIRIKKID